MKKPAALSPTTLVSSVDHLVVAAARLDQGVQWCEATLGITPGPGGEHPLMGTHNRLFKVASPAYPAAYLEIIAINLVATPAGKPWARRWFDLDDHGLHAHVAAHGPHLVHFVASTASARRYQSARQAGPGPRRVAAGVAADAARFAELENHRA